MEAPTHSTKPKQNSVSTNPDLREKSNPKSSAFGDQQSSGSDDKEQEQSMEFGDVPETLNQADSNEDTLVSGGLHLDTVYTSLKQELYVISEEDQTSYRETNLQESQRGSLTNLRSVLDDFTVDSRKGSIKDPDPEQLYSAGADRKHSEKRLTQSIVTQVPARKLSHQPKPKKRSLDDVVISELLIERDAQYRRALDLSPNDAKQAEETFNLITDSSKELQKAFNEIKTSDLQVLGSEPIKSRKS